MKTFIKTKSSYSHGRYQDFIEDKEERIEMNEDKAEELKITEKI